MDSDLRGWEAWRVAGGFSDTGEVRCQARGWATGLRAVPIWSHVFTDVSRRVVFRRPICIAGTDRAAGASGLIAIFRI